ncbi:ZPR1 zinc finger domain-containing protein [Sulfolobus sp. E5-1-F]|uniref:ZPR1 zinc finger domain-containing protein n=1 Tax=Sulfolobaceae TaxID=118883 RepID=UPI0012974BD9|nr:MULTISPECIES: ZPR1 zinc finger domain-containing protein [unclassified Sulfolobus]QGA53566.1 ZPR1 zinc finger domain-containing protein [Sulfolobus sp. E5-1-F]QGA68767.1 ZPR1 zinc finger domain-containing protein [Sulfolobus sp. E11-6]
MSEGPKVIFEEILICPMCKSKTLKAIDYLYDTPHAGKLILSNWYCENCGYKFRDVKPYEAKEPTIIEMRIENEDDLRTMIYRSAFAKIIIPELGIEIEPAGMSQGYISTIEGVLEILLDQVGNFCDNECENRIKSAMEGKIKFTLIVEDESGLSFIKSEKAIIKPLILTNFD